jgi:hypothetical protein
MGANPFRKKCTLSDEQRQEVVARLAKASGHATTDIDIGKTDV